MPGPRDIILPIVGLSAQRLAEVIGPLKEAGYHVTLIHDDLPIETAARRAWCGFGNKAGLFRWTT
jgi:hypothetical protein